MAYMTKRNTSTHEWWKDQADHESQLIFLNSYRSAQRERSAAGWRRAGALGLFVVALGFIIQAVGNA